MFLANILIAVALLGSTGTERSSEIVPEDFSVSCPAGAIYPDPVILFEPKSSELDQLAKDTLEYLGNGLREHDRLICLWLVGECDPATDGANCEYLAAQRVQVVMKFLVEYGVDRNSLAPLPEGKSPPPCDLEACRVSNRRVYLMSPGQGDCRYIPTE